MIANLIRIQKEACRLLNKWAEGYETALLEELVTYVNKMSPYEVVNRPGTLEWVVRNKKTLKEIEQGT